MPRRPSSLPDPIDRPTLRIADANFNRAKEGLRVCEDICRFALGKIVLTKKFSGLRHRLTQTLKASRFSRARLLMARDTGRDPGRNLILGPKRKGLETVFVANIQRAKEATRVLEEITKPWDPGASRALQRLRFKIYALEKKTSGLFTT
jgi:hypothetical protein